MTIKSYFSLFLGDIMATASVFVTRVSIFIIFIQNGIMSRGFWFGNFPAEIYIFYAM